MVFYGQKYKIGLIAVSAAFSFVDLFLMRFYGFTGQALIALYVVLGLVAICALMFVLGNVVPSVTLDDKCKTITTCAVYDERSRYTKNQTVTFYTIHLDEVTRCEIVGKCVVLSMKWGGKKTLYLSFFTNRQICKIQKEIQRRLP